MASNGNFSADAICRRMDEYHNSWESLLDIKPSNFNSRHTSVLNRHALSGSNASVEAADKTSDTAPRIEGRLSEYIYGGKLDMHVPAHFDLPGNT